MVPLTRRMSNELQMILSGMEVGDFLASLKACGRAEIIVVQLRTEMLQLIEEQYKDEIKRHREEIENIKAMMPAKQRLLT